MRTELPYKPLERTQSTPECHRHGTGLNIMEKGENGTDTGTEGDTDLKFGWLPTKIQDKTKQHSSVDLNRILSHII